MKRNKKTIWKGPYVYHMVVINNINDKPFEKIHVGAIIKRSKTSKTLWYVTKVENDNIFVTRIK